MTLSTAWTQNLTPEEKENFELILRNNTQLFNRLTEIIQERKLSHNRKSFSESDFEDPNWSHKQAHRLGREAELEWFLSLIP